MAMIRQMLQPGVAVLGRLSRREQRLVTVFGVLLVAAGVYVFAVEPVVAGRASMERRIASLSRDISTMESLGGRIAALEVAVAGAAGPRAADKEFSLFSFIDRATSAAVSREAVASMNPSRRPSRDGFEESAVELRLVNVTLPEVVGLLRQIDEAVAPVFVKRFELKRRYADSSRFDAVIVAGAVSRT